MKQLSFMNTGPKMTYISLFSSAGVGCYGFKMENYDCIATNEIIERRLAVQKANKKCRYASGYISGDIKKDKTKQEIYKEIDFWKKNEHIKEVDVLIATPPCQGISVANHKKKNEKDRNSLIIESIKLTEKIKPKFFIFENVRSFLNTICTDVDGKDKKISEAIEKNLGGNYNILPKVINFKEHGNNSSRTRTLVIGTRKDLSDITPYDLFPDRKQEKKLKEIIGNLPRLKNMGEFSKNDIYHNFKKYNPQMMAWIENIKEGQSAFDNKDPKKRPHRIVDGKIIYNKKKNGDKYTRCNWNKTAPCIHTRNDIFASQATIHPEDNRVFSIRELMLLMTIPQDFRWVDFDLDHLNKLEKNEKIKLMSKEEINIRQSIGEAVPTEIFRQIAEKIKKNYKQEFNITRIKQIIKKNNLNVTENLINFIKNNKEKYSLPEILKITELSNTQRQNNAGYYTRQDICFSLVNNLPGPEKFKELNILEPAVGSGNFLPLLIKKYEDIPKVNIDVVDIDKNSIKILQEIIKLITTPQNIKINFYTDDFLLKKINKKYDIIIGNPPFGKITKSKELLQEYKKEKYNDKTNNIFSFFLEKTIKTGKTIALISPKSILTTPEFNKTRELLNNYNIQYVIDHGESAFDGVKIETIGFILNTTKNNNDRVKIESYINKSINYLHQNYIFDKNLPVWTLYRDDFFDELLKKLKFDIFTVFRDRTITKKHTKPNGDIRVLKSRNIENQKIINIDGYDSYIKNGEADNFLVSKFINQNDCVLVPNLSYNPRACFLPKNSITDGSVAILKPKNNITIKEKDLSFFSSEEFKRFYMIVKNLGTRSLNIDSNSVYFFGIKR